LLKGNCLGAWKRENCNIYGLLIIIIIIIITPPKKKPIPLTNTQCENASFGVFSKSSADEGAEVSRKVYISHESASLGYQQIC